MMVELTPELSPRARAAAADAERLIFRALQGLEWRHKRDATRVSSALATSKPMRTTYQRALQEGNQALVDGLVYNTAGFISALMETGNGVATAVVATLLTHAQKPLEGAWCRALLEAMRDLGIIGPNA